MLERKGDIITKVGDNTKRNTIHPPIIKNVEVDSTIHTDEYRSYNGLNAL